MHPGFVSKHIISDLSRHLSEASLIQKKENK
jgi:hypothetical protein